MFSNTGTTNETFQQSGKQDSFRHILLSSAGMHGSSGSQFFRITTGIQSRPEALDESRFIMTFLTILGVTEILSNFRLVLKGKISKEVKIKSSRLKFLEKILANNFALSGADGNTSGSLKLFTFVKNTISNSLKVLKAKFLGSDGLFCFICKFGSFKNLFATITSLPKF